MIEMFRHYRLDLLEQQILAHAQQVVAEHLAAEVPVTARQIHRELAAARTLDEGWTFERFNQLLSKGLQGGHVDWAMTPACRTQLAAVGGAHGWAKELWVRSAVCLDEWLDATCRGKCNVRTSGGQHWHLHQLYAAAEQIAFELKDGDGFRVLYLSDEYNVRTTARDLMLAQVKHMVKVKVARHAYNREAGHEAWRPEGMRNVAAGGGSGTRHVVNQHLKRAERLIEEKVQFTDLGAPAGDRRLLADLGSFELRSLLQPVLS